MRLNLLRDRNKPGALMPAIPFCDRKGDTRSYNGIVYRINHENYGNLAVMLNRFII